MSHTRKDDPYWVKAADPARREKHPTHSAWLHGRGECDLDEDRPSHERGRRAHCRHYADATGTRYPWTAPPPKEVRQLEYWRPHRAAVNGQLRRALTDDDLFDEGGLDFRNHRHHPAASGWWD